MKRETVWKRIHQTGFHLQCLSKGHDVRIHGAGHSLIYVKCFTCRKVWRFHFIKLNWTIFDEWTQAGGK